MTDHPIIFSGPMVRALLEGRKTQTRRLAWRLIEHGRLYRDLKPSSWQHVRPGDRLWVRENFRLEPLRSSPGGKVLAVDCHYQATEAGDFLPAFKWKPSIHLPRVHSRLTLVVTAMKVERLHDISEADKLAEGAEPGRPFGTIWKAIHGEEAWLANLEVVALTFTVHQQNIDALTKAAE